MRLIKYDKKHRAMHHIRNFGIDDKIVDKRNGHIYLPDSWNAHHISGYLMGRGVQSSIHSSISPTAGMIQKIASTVVSESGSAKYRDEIIPYQMDINVGDTIRTADGQAGEAVCLGPTTVTLRHVGGQIETYPRDQIAHSLSLLRGRKRFGALVS
jgi:hypothetical protein